MVLLLRYTAPRISDVVTLTQEHIKGTYLQKRAVKNGRMIRVELPREVLRALDMLPHPKAALQESTSFFAGGKSSIRSLVKRGTANCGKLIAQLRKRGSGVFEIVYNGAVSPFNDSPSINASPLVPIEREARRFSVTCAEIDIEFKDSDRWAKLLLQPATASRSAY